MAVEGNLNRLLYKVVLFSVKVIPMVIMGIYLLNTILSYIGIDLAFLSYIIQFLFVLLMYLTSYAFKFCSWHRMFIHYIFITLVLNIWDYHIGVPLSDRGILSLYIIITSICLISAVYLKVKHR